MKNWIFRKSQPAPTNSVADLARFAQLSAELNPAMAAFSRLAIEMNKKINLALAEEMPQLEATFERLKALGNEWAELGARLNIGETKDAHQNLAAMEAMMIAYRDFQLQVVDMIAGFNAAAETVGG